MTNFETFVKCLLDMNFKQVPNCNSLPNDLEFNIERNNVFISNEDGDLVEFKFDGAGIYMNMEIH